MSVLSPSFTGKTGISSSGPAFLEKMKARVESGLLTGKPHRRARYVVTRHTQQELAFRASDFITAINVGLNEVSLRAVGDGTVEYSVRYQRWAAYVVGLGALLGGAFVVAFLFWDIGAQVERYPLVGDPALNRSVGLAALWALIAFWALVWPWLLVMMHRPAARRLLERIIRDVDVATPLP